jgi:hypothetical protein
MIGTVQPSVWPRQLPGNRPVWGRCEFRFDPACTDYDWLVVYLGLAGRLWRPESYDRIVRDECEL